MFTFLRLLIFSPFLSLSTAFLIYVAATLSIVLALILHFEPRYGQTNMLIYLGICSLMGSLTVIMFLKLSTIHRLYVIRVIWLLNFIL
jgi:hypothetical protein